VFGEDRSGERIGLVGERKRFTLGKVLQGDENIVARVELEDSRIHLERTIVAKRAQQCCAPTKNEIQAMTSWRDSPSPSMPSSTTSPAFRYCGGFMPKPTPAGVPVLMTSPGRSVMNWLT